MSNVISIEKKQIAGYAIRTNNNDAATSIPLAWEKFMSEAIASKIPGKLSDEVFAVYTDFTNEGKSNEGEYTFIVGVEVSSDIDLPKDLSSTVIATSNYHQFPVAENKPGNVFTTWMDIWQKTDLGNTYLSDFEQYSTSGEINIFVGTNT